MARLRRNMAGLVIAVGVVAAGTTGAAANSAQTTSPGTPSVAVYVRDFELHAPTGGAPARKALTTPGSKDSKKNSDTTEQTETPEARARRIKDLFAETLVEALRRKGYSSAREQGRTVKGILLEGVFAEADEKNRIRRAIVGRGSTKTKFLLYVGTFDQKSLGQPLYKEAVVQERDERYGPVITLNAYIPLAKYEIDKGSTEEDVRKICERIADHLTELLSRNPWVADQSR